MNRPKCIGTFLLLFQKVFWLMRAMLLLKQQHRNCKILLPRLNTNNNNNKVQSYSMYIRININKESHLLQFWQNSKHMQAVVNYLAVYILNNNNYNNSVQIKSQIMKLQIMNEVILITYHFIAESMTSLTLDCEVTRSPSTWFYFEQLNRCASKSHSEN